jgi:hypothetical protein
LEFCLAQEPKETIKHGVSEKVGREKIVAEVAARLPLKEDTHSRSEGMVTEMSEWMVRKYPEQSRTAITV